MSRYIDAEWLKDNLYRRCSNEVKRNGYPEEYGLIDFIEMLNYAPAADIPRWIPVTEGLPEERGTYLVTVNDGGIRVAIAQWWYDVDNGEGFFSCDDCYAEDIVAWIPLPTPYKGGEEK